MNEKIFQTALEAFINFDYKECALTLSKEVEEDPQPIYIFLLVICLRKLNESELVENYAKYALKIWDSWEQDLNWEKTILALCVDLESFDNLIRTVSDPARKSQIYFYEALKYLVDIEEYFSITVGLLRQCVQTKAENNETITANLLLGKISRYDFPDNKARGNLSSLYLDCVEDFIKEDFESFIKHYQLIGKIQNRHDLEEMLLIFFLKAGEDELAENLFTHKIENWRTYYGENWTPNLVAFGLGKINRETLLGRADNDLKKGEAYYYIAMQALIHDRPEEAKSALESCIALDLAKYSTEANLATLFYNKYFKGGASRETILQVFENLIEIVSDPSSINVFYEERLPQKNKQFEDYFQQEIPHEAVEITGKCIGAFIMQEYKECVKLAVRRLNYGMNYSIALLELISLHWLGKSDVAEAKGRRYAEILDNQFGEVWLGHLQRLFIGSMTPEELLEKAKTQLQKFQAFYYIGQYYYLKREYEAAYNFLQQGLAIMPEEKGFEQANIEGAMREISINLSGENSQKKKIPLPILRKLSTFKESLPKIDRIENPVEKYAIAREYADIFETYYPDNKNILAILYNFMSIANYDLGKIGDSETQINHAIELLQSENTGADQNTLINYYVQKSRVLHHKGELDAAKQMLRDLLDGIDESDENIFDYVSAFENLGLIYSETGEFNKALPLLQRVVELFRKQGDDSGDHLARAITNEAGLHERIGDYFYAKAKYEEALSVMENAAGKNNLSYARILNYLAKCNKNLGVYHEALPQYKEAISLVERIAGKQHPFYSTVLNNIGKLYERLYDYEKAEKIFIECLDLSRIGFGEYHPKHALANRNLADVYKNQGKFNEAVPLTLKAIQIWTDYYGDDYPELGTEYSSLALIYSANFMYDQAEYYYQKSLQIIARSLGKNHESYLDTLHSYAVAQYFSKKYEDSASSYKEALLIAKNIFGSSHPDISKLSHELANVLKALGQWEEAISLLEEAINVQDRFIENAFSITSENQRTRYLKKQLGVYHTYISHVVNAAPNDAGLLKKAYELVLKRKGIFTDYLSDIHLRYLSNDDSILNKKVLELFQIKERIFKFNIEASKARPGDNTINRLTSRQEELEAEISLHFSGSYSFWPSKDWTFEKVLSAMDSELIYIDFIRFPNSVRLDEDFLPFPVSIDESTYAAFIIDPQSSSKINLVNLGKGKIIDEYIRNYRSLIIKQIGVAYLNKIGEELYRMIIEPLLPFIKGRRKLMVSPDGLINILPIQILPIPNQNQEMIDQYEITYIPVIRDILKYSTSEKVKGNPAVVVADPDFDYQNNKDDSEGIFTRLPGTKEEGEVVAKLLKIVPITGKKAIKQNILKIESPTILHLATHGFFLESLLNPKNQNEEGISNLSNFYKLRLLQNPLRRSGLALSGINAWSRGLPTDVSVDNGILSAEEIAQLDLRGTQLVVLSACETGLGNIEEGEGVIGMRRSFVISGAQGLIMSLWSIPDEQTKNLIVTMYSEILSRRDCVSALRQAQITIRKKYSHPLFWGGFIYQGDHINSIEFN